MLGAEAALCMAQDRKVFVGGVPQDLNQDDLYSIFNEYAGVKKAWLQKCRADDNSTNSPQQNHRGFGFVIFHDPSAIEVLLGGSPSRFIVLRSGAKLEVKKALSSSKMSGVSSQTEAAQARSVGAGYAQPPQQVQQAGQEPVAGQQRFLQPQPPLASTWPAPINNASVLSQLALMPNSTPAYPSTNLRSQASVPGNAQMVPGRGLISSDAAAMPFSTISQTSAPQAKLSYSGLLPTHGQAVPNLEEQGSGARQGHPTNKTLREAMVQFYLLHKPDKLQEDGFLKAGGQLDSMLSYYENNLSELDASLRRKYGSGLDLTQDVPNRHPMSQGGPAAPAMMHSAFATVGSTPSAINTGISSGIPQRSHVGTGNGQPNNDLLYSRQLNAEASKMQQAMLQPAQLPRQTWSQATQQAAVAATASPQTEMSMDNGLASITSTSTTIPGSGAKETAVGERQSNRLTRSPHGGNEDGFEISVSVAESIVGHLE